MEKVNWKVEGMTCSNCALTVHKYLEKEGAQQVAVSVINGDVSFALPETKDTDKLAKGINSLGYQVEQAGKDVVKKKKFLANNKERFFACLPFTLILMLHMFPGLHHISPFHYLMNGWVQLVLCLPPFIIGMSHFGRSAIKSLRNGVPNMNVLISIGAASAFIYSLVGLLMGLGDDYLFFETAATIITLVFLGELLEDASVQSTQRALKGLVKSQKVMANMIAFDDQHQEHIFPIENTQLKVGDLILIRQGEQVPADCKILWGDVQVNEALLTGESSPLQKGKKDALIGGSVVEEGTAKAQVTAVGGDTVLSSIVKLVNAAQGEKPPVQQLADRISAIFVPIVLGIALLTLIINWWVLGAFTPALMRSIAVLVIACPCAMGLATPAAIAVGLGRAARNGILFRNAKSLETFKDIQQVVFDKTGTLTTGKFAVSNFQLTKNSISEDEFKRIVFSLEKYSTHPLAQSITKQWSRNDAIRWKNINEEKGVGITAIDAEGVEYKIGSYRIAEGVTTDRAHNMYLLRNNQLLGWIDLQDELRPEAADVVKYLKARNIKTILLSGDRKEKTQQIAQQLGLDEAIAEQTPEQKLQQVARLTAQASTVMVGDGINDAPALAKATVGVSMSDATQLAVQSAQVVLMNNGLAKLPTALGLGKHTYRTIQQNLFWAFFYNIIAIPVAAFGLLTPIFGALVMGLSDVVLGINSVRLFVKRVV